MREEHLVYNTVYHIFKMVSVVKDSKGPTYIISHKRSGITVSEFFCLDELKEIRDLINEILKDN